MIPRSETGVEAHEVLCFWFVPRAAFTVK